MRFLKRQWYFISWHFVRSVVFPILINIDRCLPYSNTSYYREIGSLSESAYHMTGCHIYIQQHLREARHNVFATVVQSRRYFPGSFVLRAQKTLLDSASLSPYHYLNANISRFSLLKILSRDDGRYSKVRPMT